MFGNGRSNGLRSNSNHPEQVSKGRPRRTSFERVSLRLEEAALWVLFRTRMVIFRTRMVCVRTRIIQNRFAPRHTMRRLEMAALLRHLSNLNGLRSNSNGLRSNSNGMRSNLNHPEQVSKGRPCRTSSINLLRPSSGFSYVWKWPPSCVIFRTRMVCVRT